MQLIVSRDLYPFLYSDLYLQKQHYSLVKSLVINFPPQNCHRVCESVSSRTVVSWYVWHQTKKIVVPLDLCPVVLHAACRVVSHMCELRLCLVMHV